MNDALAWLTQSVIGNASLPDIILSVITVAATCVAFFLWWQAGQDRRANIELQMKQLSQQAGQFTELQIYRFERRHITAMNKVSDERARLLVLALIAALNVISALYVPAPVRIEFRLFSLVIWLFSLVVVGELVRSALFSLWCRNRLDDMAKQRKQQQKG